VTGNSPSVPLILGTHYRLYFCDLVVSGKKLGGGGTYLAVPRKGPGLTLRGMVVPFANTTGRGMTSVLGEKGCNV
jgi:hypothetical protein